MMKTVALPTGEAVPALGLGTWQMGEAYGAKSDEVAAIRYAIDCGYRLFDTAEMYGEGGAETVLGIALADALRSGAVERAELFIVSKVYPHNATRDGVEAACDRSRKRLGLDTIDLYLLHWPGSVPLVETIDAFETVKARGAIRDWGVSNFDIDILRELDAIERPTLTARPRKLHCVTNQVCYALDERGIEFSLLPYQRAMRMPTMAYCPLGRGSLSTHPALVEIANARGTTAAQVALAWVMRAGDVIAIPKAVGHDHLKENLAAAEITLTAAELAAIDAVFRPPQRKGPLAVV